MADIDQEYVYSWLGRSNHVFCRGHEFDNGVVEFSACPPISRLIPYLVPIEELRDFVRELTHATTPAKHTAEKRRTFKRKIINIRTDYHHQQIERMG